MSKPNDAPREVPRLHFLYAAGSSMAGILSACSGNGGSALPSTTSQIPQPTGTSGTPTQTISPTPSSPAPIPSGLNASLTIGTSPQGTLPAGMIGFSYEKGELISGKAFTGTNSNLIACFRRLSTSGVLRIGGNTSDLIGWAPTATTPTVSGSNTKACIDGLAAFLRAVNWKCIYGLNLHSSTPAQAADEAAYAAQALGSNLLTIEIGNECEMYEPSLSAFLTVWQQFADAIRTSVPNVRFSGPSLPGDQSLITGWTIPFANAKGTMIDVLTMHHYADPGNTIQELITFNTNLNTQIRSCVAAAQANNISGGFRIDETNSHAGGGKSGVSNVFGSALWAIDYIMNAAQNGCLGLNFHGGANFTYTAIHDTRGVVDGLHPLYYGLFLSSLAGTGTFMPATWNGLAGLNISAYAVRHADGTTAIVVNNKETTTTVNARISLNAPASQATVTALTCPGGISATDGTIIGGVPVGIDGSWTPQASTPISVSGGNFVVSVPPSSASLFVCQ